jgi:hypothetical protein
MPAGAAKSLLDTAAEAVRHLAWYLGYHAGASGPRDV